MDTRKIDNAEVGRLAHRIQEAAGGYIYARENFDNAQAALAEARKELLRADSAFTQSCIEAGVWPVDDTEMYIPFRGALWALTLKGEPDPSVGRSNVTSLVRIVSPAELIAEFNVVLSGTERKSANPLHSKPPQSQEPSTGPDGLYDSDEYMGGVFEGFSDEGEEDH